MGSAANSHQYTLDFAEQKEERKQIKSELNAFAEPYLSQSPISNESTSPYFEQIFYEKQSLKLPQNRSEEKEVEHNLYSDKSIESNLQNHDEEYEAASSNVHTFDSNEVSKETPSPPPSRLRRKKITKNAPLWSAIAKQHIATPITVIEAPKKSKISKKSVKSVKNPYFSGSSS